MKKHLIILLTTTLLTLFACTTQQPKKPVQKGYLKDDITQAELNNATNFKRYYYSCTNADTGATSYLTTYFPLWRESRMKGNFGFYFQLDGGKALPFHHVGNIPLNASGTRFEVRYRSYNPINGVSVELIAREQNSTYYKNYQGFQSPWLNCQGG